MNRKEAIKRLEYVKDNALIQKTNGISEYWQMEIDKTIDALDTAIEALKAQDWIPCSERFPEKRGIYFVTEQNFGGREEADMHEVVSHSSYYYGNDKWSDRFYSDDVSNITAWMPLPPDYEGE